MRKICSSIFLGNLDTFCLRLTLRSLLSSSSFKRIWIPSIKLFSSNSTGRKCRSKTRKSFWAVSRIAATLCNWVCIFSLSSFKACWLTPDKIIWAANNSWLTVSCKSRAIRFLSFSMIASSLTRLWFSAFWTASVKRLSLPDKDLKLASKSGSAKATTSFPANSRLRLTCIFLRETSSITRQKRTKKKVMERLKTKIKKMSFSVFSISCSK